MRGKLLLREQLEERRGVLAAAAGYGNEMETFIYSSISSVSTRDPSMNVAVEEM